jgi:hypothetical protein
MAASPSQSRDSEHLRAELSSLAQIQQAARSVIAGLESLDNSMDQVGERFRAAEVPSREQGDLQHLWQAAANLGPSAIISSVDGVIGGAEEEQEQHGAEDAPEQSNGVSEPPFVLPVNDRGLSGLDVQAAAWPPANPWGLQINGLELPGAASQPEARQAQAVQADADEGCVVRGNRTKRRGSLMSPESKRCKRQAALHASQKCREQLSESYDPADGDDSDNEGCSRDDASTTGSSNTSAACGEGLAAAAAEAMAALEEAQPVPADPAPGSKKRRCAECARQHRRCPSTRPGCSRSGELAGPTPMASTSSLRGKRQSYEEALNRIHELHKEDSEESDSSSVEDFGSSPQTSGVDSQEDAPPADQEDALPASPLLQRGDRAVIYGLSSERNLNGRRVTIITRQEEDGCELYLVEFDADELNFRRPGLKIRVENLKRE